MVVLPAHFSGSQHRSAIFAALPFYYSWNVPAIMPEHSSCKRKPLPPKCRRSFIFLFRYCSCNVSATTLMLSCYNINAVIIQPYRLEKKRVFSCTSETPGYIFATWMRSTLAQEGVGTRRAQITETLPSTTTAATNARYTHVRTKKEGAIEMRKADSAKSA